MQQMQPPQGRLFPDKQEQQSAPRFSSNAQGAAQNYEPQLRMQQSGSLPIYQSNRYPTGQMQPVQASQPVNTLPPMSTMPTAQAYQQQLAQQAMQQQSTVEKPVLLHTIQGQPVLIDMAEIRQTLGLDEQPTHEESLKKLRKARQTMEQKKTSKQEKQSRFTMKMSVTWFLFGLVGMGTAGVLVLRFVITFLLRLKGQL